jgi:hypothetical protein
MQKQCTVHDVIAMNTTVTKRHPAQLARTEAQSTPLSLVSSHLSSACCPHWTLRGPPGLPGSVTAPSACVLSLLRPPGRCIAPHAQVCPTGSIKVPRESKACDSRVSMSPVPP